MPRLGLGLGSSLIESGAQRGGRGAAFTNNYSVSFDGTNDNITGMGNCPDGNFTISAWVKMDWTSGAYFKAIYTTVGSLQIWFGIREGESPYGYPGIHIGGGDIVTAGAATFPMNTWGHVVATWDGTNTELWVNGVSKVTDSSKSSNPTATTAVIGIYGAGNPFKGNIDELAIWDAVLDDDAVAAVYNSGAPFDLTADSGDYDNSGDLVNYWRFEEGTGTSTDDPAGSDDGTLVNGTAWDTDVPG